MANFGIIGNTLIKLGLYKDVFGLFVDFVAFITHLFIVITLSIVATFHSGKRLLEYIEAGIASIPGIRPIYHSFRRMGDVILKRGLDNFQSVKIVEFTRSINFSLTFETNQVPVKMRIKIGIEEFVTLLIPPAQKPT